MDLKDAYWQIGLAEEAKPLTAFTVPGRPLYQFVVMPFAIIRIAEQFKKANLTLNVSKSKFCVTEVNYLGYIIDNGGIKTDPEKVESIRNWPTPKNLKQVRGFLGLAGWYRRFINNFSSIVYPITEVLSTKKKFSWTTEVQKSFQEIKNLLTSAPILVNPDFSKKFYLHCDASDYGIGAVLVQLDDNGEEKPIAFMSKKLNTAQRNYSVTERECLAALEAIKKFRCYLELQEFEVITDHSSLVWLMKQQDLTGRLARWVWKLQGFKFSISHRKGKHNVVPDALSRIPCSEVDSLELTEPEIDLNSIHFNDDDYKALRQKITDNESKFPDLKIVDNFV